MTQTLDQKGTIRISAAIDQAPDDGPPLPPTFGGIKRRGGGDDIKIIKFGDPLKLHYEYPDLWAFIRLNCQPTPSIFYSPGSLVSQAVRIENLQKFATKCELMNQVIMERGHEEFGRFCIMPNENEWYPLTLSVNLWEFSAYELSKIPEEQAFNEAFERFSPPMSALALSTIAAVLLAEQKFKRDGLKSNMYSTQFFSQKDLTRWLSSAPEANHKEKDVLIHSLKTFIESTGSIFGHAIQNGLKRLLGTIDEPIKAAQKARDFINCDENQKTSVLRRGPT